MKNKIIKVKNEVILVYYNIVNNDYQQDSRVLHIFVPNKSSGRLLQTSPTNLIFLKKFNLEFSNVKVWFTDEISNPLDIKDKVNLNLLIKWCKTYKMGMSVKG